MRKALVVGIVLALLAAGAAAVLLTRPKPVPTAPPVPMAGRPEVAYLRSVKECEVRFGARPETFKLTQDEVVRLADIAEASAVDNHPAKWAFDAQLTGTCGSGAWIEMACSRRGEFRILCHDGERHLRVYGKTGTRPSIYECLQGCKSTRP